VKACKGANCSGFSATDTGWRNLTAPTNVQASDGTYTNKVLVSWNASSGATLYQVYRADSAAGVKSLLGSPAGTLFNDTTATPGVTYYYWVIACKGANCSGYSAYDTGWRNLTAPTNVLASDGTYTNKVQVTWDASSGATSYQVYRAESAAGAKSLLGSPAGILFNDTTATPGLTYYYWVIACKGLRCSGYSTYDTGWRNLTAPTNVQASDGTYTNKVQVSWVASSGATTYQVYRADSAAGVKTLLGSPAGTLFNDTTATPGITYFYWVTACKGTRCSGFSVADTGWRNLTAPTNVLASDGTYTNKVQVGWDAASGVTTYQVYRAASAAGAKSLLGSPAGTLFNDTTATPGVTYFYWVIACKGARCSGYSAYNTGWRAP
jgi:fibronectin type 3 domain-containing protein